MSSCGKGWGARSGGVVFLRRCDLVRLKLTALRRGVWFRVLSRIERSLVDLAIVTVRRVRSFVLAQCVGFVVEKLGGVFEASVQRRIQTVGFPLAKKLGEIAQSWGNRSAVGWAGDLGFARFLAMCMDVSVQWSCVS